MVCGGTGRVRIVSGRGGRLIDDYRIVTGFRGLAHS